MTKLMRAVKNIARRLKCKHERLRLVEYGDVYSDIYGYDHTRFVFECMDCGKKHMSKTRSPEYFAGLLDEYLENTEEKR